MTWLFCSVSTVGGAPGSPPEGSNASKSDAQSPCEPPPMLIAGGNETAILLRAASSMDPLASSIHAAPRDRQAAAGHSDAPLPGGLSAARRQSLCSPQARPVRAPTVATAKSAVE